MYIESDQSLDDPLAYSQSSVYYESKTAMRFVFWCIDFLVSNGDNETKIDITDVIMLIIAKDENNLEFLFTELSKNENLFNRQITGRVIRVFDELHHKS